MTGLVPLVQVLVLARNRIWLDILPFQGNVDITFLMQTEQEAKKAQDDGHNAIVITDLDLSSSPQWDIVFAPYHFGTREVLRSIESFCWLYKLARDLLIIRDNNYDLIPALASIDMRLAAYEQLKDRPHTALCGLSRFEGMANMFDVKRFESHGLQRFFPHYTPDSVIHQKLLFDTHERNAPQAKRDLEQLDKRIGGIFSEYLFLYYKQYSQNVRSCIDIREPSELIRLTDTSGAVVEAKECKLSAQNDLPGLPAQQWKDAVVKRQASRFVVHPQTAVPRPRLLNVEKNQAALAQFLKSLDVPYTAAPQQLYYLPGAQISGYSLHVYDAQNRLVPETEYLNDSALFWRHAPETHCVRFPAVARRLDIPRTSLILFNACHRDYFHWHIDALPAITQARKLGMDDVCVVTMPLAQWQRDSLDLLGVENRFELRPGHYTADDIFYPTVLRGEAFSPHPTILDGYQVIKKRLAERTEEQTPAVQSGKRLYVSRHDAERRVLANESELAAAMEKRGFTVIAPGELPYSEQIQVFSQAEIIVGPHGAGLTNIVYSDNLRLLFEIFPEPYLNPCFIRLANLKGAASAQAAYPSKDAETVGFIHKLTWEVDLDDLLKRIDAALDQVEP
ncbi:glycosyltransferase family 61 protein [Desulfovibrio inopinatus]|uniref:glycosyltransferase family 61 protein n=1 Tax=Desulfovibrio inopinatus TaxID=102109 RepID=UPI0003FAC4EB|nr:glycosyltransferase 61 family protein [Desulfovibrio inopinatus]